MDIVELPPRRSEPPVPVEIDYPVTDDQPMPDGDYQAEELHLRTLRAQVSLP